MTRPSRPGRYRRSGRSAFLPEIDLLRAGHGRDGRPSCPLEPEALCAAAMEQTGLGDFGDGASVLASTCCARRYEPRRT